MDLLTAFHRSFIDVTHLSRLVSGWSEYRRQALPGSMDAYILISNAYVPIEIFGHPEPTQDFASYATDWERRFSTLCAPRAGVASMIPVVGQPEHFGRRVIAHFGVVAGDQIVLRKSDAATFGIPAQGVSNDGEFRSFIEQGGEAYVSNDSLNNTGNWRYLATNIHRFIVVTDPEGAIHEVLGASLKDQSIEPADPMFILGIGSAIASLSVAVGKRVITSIYRKYKEVQIAGQNLRTFREWMATAPKPPIVVKTRKVVTKREMVEWETQGGHTLSRHNPDLPASKLRERIEGETTVPGPGGQITKDFRVWQGRDGNHAASKWADEATMHKAIGDHIHQNIDAIRRSIAETGSWDRVGVNPGYRTGSGWLTNRPTAGAPGPRQVHWTEDIRGFTIRIRRRREPITGQDNWYVLTSFPEVP